MISLKSRETIESKTTPGVRFTVRTLNKIQRAERDLPIADQAAAYDEMSAEFRELLPPGYFDVVPLAMKVAGLKTDLERTPGDSVKAAELAGAEAELEKLRKSVAAADTEEKAKRRNVLSYKADLMLSAYVKPSVIKAGLISIEGMEVDGKPATAELLLSAADSKYDDLIEEIYGYCESAAGLGSQTAKNSGSPTTSSGPVATDVTTISNVEPAGK